LRIAGFEGFGYLLVLEIVDEEGQKQVEQDLVTNDRA